MPLIDPNSGTTAVDYEEARVEAEHEEPALGMTPEDEHALNCGTFRGEKFPENIEVLASQITKLEDGDILLVRVSDITPPGQLHIFTQYMKSLVHEEMKIDAQVIVVRGEVAMGVVKKADLGDIHQRLDDIEKRLPPRALTELPTGERKG